MRIYLGLVKSLDTLKAGVASVLLAPLELLLAVPGILITWPGKIKFGLDKTSLFALKSSI
jgi:hypothetical protein